MTEARLEANRRAAKKSTGPRTTEGKARSRMNSLKHGSRSPEFQRMFDALADADPGAILRVGDSCLTPAQKSQPAYLELIKLFSEAEIWTIEDWREGERRWRKFSKPTSKP